jgi:TolA-binding protein
LKNLFQSATMRAGTGFWMNMKFKLAAYAVLLLLAAWFGWGFYSSYTTVTRESAAAATNDTPSAVTTNPVGATNSASPPASAADSSTNTAGQNGVEASNTVAAPANQEAKTSAPPVRTNVAAGATAPASPPAHAVQGTTIAYLAALVGALIGLGLLITHDATQFLGGVAVDALLDAEGEGMREPEYEKAEQAWAHGKHLEAVEMLRDFLKKNPRAQYAALRIAEIYEKDLRNPLAAALEYEEVLKQKLPAERWGWAAVHLCNLYSKLGQQDKAKELLQRIADEYPQTAAAKKARSHLGLPEPEPEPITKAGSTETAAEPGESVTPPGKKQPAPAAPAPPAPPAPPPKSSLPPGFRPKK